VLSASTDWKRDRKDIDDSEVGLGGSFDAPLTLVDKEKVGLSLVLPGVLEAERDRAGSPLFPVVFLRLASRKQEDRQDAKVRSRQMLRDASASFRAVCEPRPLLRRCLQWSLQLENASRIVGLE